MELRFLGHAAFWISGDTYDLLVDPFLTGNPLAPVSADEVKADMIFVTHAHGDHLGDAVAIAKRTGAVVCCTADLAEQVFTPAGVETLEGNIGGWVRLPFGRVKFTTAIHGSGAAGCLTNGFLFELEGRRIYHAGDTALTFDMGLLAEELIDVALLPIGDVYTMGPEDAVRAVKLIRPRLTVPMHYNTMPPIRQDAEAFAQAVEEEGFRARVLAPGQILAL